MTTTFRGDIADGLKTLLDSFKTANPTLLRSTFLAHPPSLNVDLPAGWVETRNESVAHVAGIRTRTMSPTVVVADRLTDNAETMARMDDLVDALLDHFTTTPHIVAGTIWDSLTISDELDQLPDGSWMQQVRFAFGNVSIEEGRN